MKPRRKPLPPLMAAAFQRLEDAFTGEVPPATGWPFVNPPRVQQLIDDAARAGAKPGAKSKVTTPLIGRLVRAIESGASIRAASRSVGISQTVAHRVLDGTHPACNPSALASAGIQIPYRKGSATAAKVLRINSERQAGTHAATARSQPFGAGPAMPAEIGGGRA